VRDGHIVRQFLVESLLLALAGAALGVVLAFAGTKALIELAADIPRIDAVHADTVVLAFTLGLTAITGLVVGLAPAFASSRGNLIQSIQEGGRSTTAGRSRGIFRDVMLAAEVALSLMLLMGAALMLKSFERMRAIDPGFSPDRLLSIRFSLPNQRYKTPAQIAAFYRDVLERVRSAPGVASVGLVTVPPLAGHYMDNTFIIEGRPPLPPGEFLDAVIRSADPGYFKAAGIPLKRGRFFSESEWGDTADKAVISESMATAFFPNEDPIGKVLRLNDRDRYEIVGIVGDARQTLSRDPEPTMYFPIYRGNYNFAALMVRAEKDPNLLSLPVQKLMRGLDSDLPAVTVRTMDEMLWGATQSSRFNLTLIGLFAGLAVVLASIGLYGVLAYTVHQRTNELGLRMALGADRSSISTFVIRQGLRPVLIGLIAGIAGGLAATRLLQTMLYQVSPTDPVVLTAVVVLFFVITVAACVLPALRATRIDPAIALRAE